MGKQFVFVYFMTHAPETIRMVVPSHVQYWENSQLKNYQGGPFADRSGGLILFETETLEDATKIIANDPFVLENLLEKKWLKEWIVE